MFGNRFVAFWSGFALFTVATARGGGGMEAGESEQTGQEAVETVRDLLWVWGNPEMTEEGAHTLASFVQAGPAERARLLCVPNVVMAGKGLPASDEEAFKLAAEVASCSRIVWEIAPDKSSRAAPFTYEDAATRLAELVKAHRQIEGVLLDDMSSVAIDHGFQPEHIRQLRALLAERCPGRKVWGVVYTMNLGREHIEEYIRELDVINLWTWHARDLVDLEAHVAACQRRFPDKPIVLGLYLYDYGDGRRLPPDLLEAQCTTALRLLHERRIQGIVFLTITNDAEALAWAADWVKRVADQPLGTGNKTVAAADFRLQLGSGEGWRFYGGQWSEDSEGIIRPPDRRNLHTRAFYTRRAYADLEAEFEFNGSYRETGTGSAGLILRAADPNHFYFVYFPWGGQQLRAKHFWAAIAKVEGDGYLRNVQMAWAPGVPSETDRWHRVRVTAQGPRIEVEVDNRRALEAVDATYAAGCVGLAGYGWYAFRNLRVTGAEVVPPDTWDPEFAIPVHAFTVGLSSETMPSGCVAPNGDVLLAAGRQLVRSKDKGRTWSAPDTLPEHLGEVSDYGNTLFYTRDRRLIVMMYRSQEQTEQRWPEIRIAESPDNGYTWSEPAPAEVAASWPEQPRNLVPYGPLVETEDGVLLRFLLGGVKEEGDVFTDVRTWSAVHAKAFVIRSADRGRSWSAPIELDQPSWVDAARGTIPGSLDLTEPTGVALGNTVLVLVRPIYSPTMWACWSYDSGATWDAAARVTFPGYAQSMIRTRSGAILCAHRYPHYAVHVSYDGGLNWDAGAVIDYPVWAMGCLVEVEPDLILCTYMNAERNLPLLAQLIQVTPAGLKPLAP